MIQEFKDFIGRGNLIEIAVAFVMGVAFAAVIASERPERVPAGVNCFSVAPGLASAT